MKSEDLNGMPFNKCIHSVDFRSYPKEEKKNKNLKKPRKLRGLWHSNKPVICLLITWNCLWFTQNIQIHSLPDQLHKEHTGPQASSTRPLQFVSCCNHLQCCHACTCSWLTEDWWLQSAGQLCDLRQWFLPNGKIIRIHRINANHIMS